MLDAYYFHPDVNDLFERPLYAVLITETSLHKKISKTKSIPHVWMAQCMTALADKVRKQEVHAMHTVICTPEHMAILFNNHPYISSSKFVSQCIHALSHPYIHELD